ncbi:hypothetical protein SUGI_0145850 [Cryptomeria japonica]|nr:hypothetical protein SUGI_0145850 [Cryptomeria japonica]
MTLVTQSNVADDAHHINKHNFRIPFACGCRNPGEAGEDAVYSNIAAVELKMLFPNKMISELTEMNLSANQEKSVMKLKEWKVDGYDGTGNCWALARTQNC